MSQRRKTPLSDLRHPAGSRGVASVGCRPLGSEAKAWRLSGPGSRGRKTIAMSSTKVDVPRDPARFVPARLWGGGAQER